MTEINTATGSKLPTVAIVGRPNVGKSSLFNAVIGVRMSIVHEMPGVTRDRVISPAVWQNRRFQLVDTGGLGMRFGETRNLDLWDERIAGQVESALADADVIVMVTNAQTGLLPLDEEVALKLRGRGKPVVLAANKSDNPKLAADASEMSALGFGSPITISCLHRTGVADLLDRVAALLPAAGGSETGDDATPEPAPVKIAVVGRPNVGKSSLVNALLGEERVMVSEVAGTTRDAIDVDFSIKYRGEIRPAVLIDTAGLRKKSKVDNAVEMFSVMRAKTAIGRADVILFVTEADVFGVTAQDRRIAALIEESGKACVLVVNKCDLCAGQPKSEIVRQMRFSLPAMRYAPLVQISAVEKRNLGALLDLVAQVMEFINVRIPTSTVNQVVADAFERTTPPVVGHAPLKFYYALQVAVAPPKFLLFVNDRKYCADNYLAYLNNALREAFDFTGSPIRVELRSRPKKVESVHTPSRSSSGRPAARPSRRPKAAAFSKPRAAKTKSGKNPGGRKNGR